MRDGLIRDAVVGSVAGYAATLVMERASTAIYERQSESSRHQEEQMRTEMPTTTLVRKVAAAVGTNIDDERAGRVGSLVHYAFGAAGGPLTARLVRSGLGAVPAGLAVGTGMWVVVDEGANAVLDLTPPAPEYPLVTHARALVAHLIYGATVGALVGLARRVLHD